MQNVPFYCLPIPLAEDILCENLSLFNNFPRKGGISDYLSLITIIANSQKQDFNLLKLKIGACLEAHKDNGLKKTYQMEGGPSHDPQHALLCH